MNAEKLSKLQAQVRIGGKGTARRKKKIVHRTAMTDDKKLQSSLKKLSVNMITGIEEANIIKQDGTVIHFNNPKVQASLSANTFAISGQNETKQITEMLPSILNQLGADSLTHLRKLASDVQVAGSKKGDSETSLTGGNVADDEDVPDLVGNFDDPSKTEGVTIKSESGDAKQDKVKEPAEKTNEEKKSTHPEGQKEKSDSEERKGREEKKESEKKNKDGKEEKQQNKKEKNQ